MLCDMSGMMYFLFELEKSLSGDKQVRFGKVLFRRLNLFNPLTADRGRFDPAVAGVKKYPLATVSSAHEHFFLFS